MTATRLYSPVTLGSCQLQNRIVMAPMTRSRAIGKHPQRLMVEYYAQRASAGLRRDRGHVAVRRTAWATARIPGIFSPPQVEGWARSPRPCTPEARRSSCS